MFELLCTDIRRSVVLQKVTLPGIVEIFLTNSQIHPADKQSVYFHIFQVRASSAPGEASPDSSTCSTGGCRGGTRISAMSMDMEWKCAVISEEVQ